MKHATPRFQRKANPENNDDNRLVVLNIGSTNLSVPRLREKHPQHILCVGITGAAGGGEASSGRLEAN